VLCSWQLQGAALLLASAILPSLSLQCSSPCHERCRAASLSAAAHLGCLSIVVLLRACTARRCAIGAELKIGSDLSSGVASQAEVADLLICFAIVNLPTQSHSPALRRAPALPLGPLGTSPWPKRDEQVRRRALCAVEARRVLWADRRGSGATSTARSGSTRTRQSSSRHARNQCVAELAPTAHAAHALERPDSAARARAESA
jgi:hypothetical protein